MAKRKTLSETAKLRADLREAARRHRALWKSGVKQLLHAQAQRDRWREMLREVVEAVELAGKPLGETLKKARAMLEEMP